MNARGIENITGEGTVTFEEIREEDGERVAVLAVEIEMETETEGEDESDGSEVTIEFERSIEGQVLWSLETGAVLSGSFSADSEWTRTVTGETEHEGETYEVSQATTFSGTIEYELTIERE